MPLDESELTTTRMECDEPGTGRAGLREDDLLAAFHALHELREAGLGLLYVYDHRRRPASLAEEALAEEYSAAVAGALDETGLPDSAFPASCPYSAEQLQDDGFLPD